MANSLLVLIILIAVFFSGKYCGAHSLKNSDLRKRYEKWKTAPESKTAFQKWERENKNNCTKCHKNDEKEVKNQTSKD